MGMRKGQGEDGGVLEWTPSFLSSPVLVPCFRSQGPIGVDLKQRFF